VLLIFFFGVEYYKERGGNFTNFYITSNTKNMNSSKQTIGAKINSREGKSPDHKLRSLNIIK